MLTILTQILRVAIMAFTSAAPLTALQQFFDGTVQKLVEAIKDEQGLTLDEAKDIVANILIELTVNSVALGVIIKTKLGARAAEYLGFKTRGFSKRKLTAKAEVAVKKMSGPWETFKKFSLFSKILSLVGILNLSVWTAKAIADIVEPGIYQTKQTNDVYEKFIGIRPYPEKGHSLQAGNLDAEKFNEVAGSLETSGVKGIQNPKSFQTQLYSREGLADVIDYVYGRALLAGNVPNDFRQTMKLVAPYLIGGQTSAPATAVRGSTLPSEPVVGRKVFTGSVIQSALGSAVPFEVRPDDLIEDIEELKSAIQNNEGPWLASLPSRLIRDIKVVASVTTKDGLTKRGTAKQIIAGYLKDGTPKYRTVVNKFAVADYYVLTDTGAKTRITRIIYGPTDAVKFKPSQEDLSGLDQTLKSSLASLAPAIAGTLASGMAVDALSGQSTTLFPAPGSVPTPIISVNITKRDYFVPFDDFYDQVFYREGNTIIASPTFGSILSAEEREKIGNYGAQTSEAIARLKKLGYPVDSYPHRKFHWEIDGKAAPMITARNFEEFFGSSISISERAAADSLPLKALEASTLFQFYNEKGEPLPPISQRGLIYESLGIGQASYYTGTAEQNMKLLAKLQGKI